MKTQLKLRGADPSSASPAPCRCGDCARCKGSLLQRAATTGESPAEVPASVQRVLAGSGRPLDAAMRRPFEAGLGQDFSGVRVHTGAQAAASAREVHARAYTVGRDIVFGEGAYAPQSSEGRRLLAHELTHVAQQRSLRAEGALRIGGAHDAHEAQAERAAQSLVQGEAVGGLGRAPAGLLQRDPLPGVPSPIAPAFESLANVDIGSSDTVSTQHPALQRVAAACRANPGARVSLTAYLTEGAKGDSARETRERSQLSARMHAIREALKALGVPEDRIEAYPATMYAASAKGDVSVLASRLNLKPVSLPPMAYGPQPAQQVQPGPVAAGGGAPAAAGGLPSLNLDVKFGPVTISLPKEVRAKLPIVLSRSKSLVIDLSYEVPAKFNFKMTLDGTRYVRVSLKAGAEVDAKKGAVTGSAGLVIDTEATTCHATSNDELRNKIKSAGDKLNKAAGEFAAAATFDEKLSKGIDIAGAIGEMYEAVDKAKAGCKSTPRASLEFGYKRLLTPGSETDPAKQPPLDTIGITGTLRF